MKILAVETSTKACSAALWLDGEVVEQFEVAPQKHAHLILPQVEQCFAEAGLPKGEVDCLAFGEGPGAFTGVRIAAGVIQGLALGWQKPVLAVSSLEALMWQGFQQTGQTQWHAFLDARMKEVYWQSGQVLEGEVQSSQVALCSPEQADLLASIQQKDAWGVGDIVDAYPDLSAQFGERWLDALPRASAIAEVASQKLAKEVALASPVTEEIPLPVYLRNNVADKPKSRA